MDLVKKIMLLISTLVLLFIVSMLVLSELNLNSAKNIYDKFQSSQIDQIFSSNSEKIKLLMRKSENSVSDIALMGEFMYKHKISSKDWVEAYLKQKVGHFEDEFGAGIWFEPYLLDPKQKYFGPYASKDRSGLKLTWEYSDKKYDYLNQDWYRLAIPVDWDRAVSRPKKFYWSDPYYDEIVKTAMITVDAFMHDDAGRIIGIATIDWGLDDIIDKISKIKITPNSFSFLIDIKAGKVICYSKKKDMALSPISGINWSIKYFPNIKEGELRTIDAIVDGQPNSIYYTKVANELILGIGAPKSELFEEIENLKSKNHQIALLAAVVMLVISVMAILMIRSMVRLLDSLYTDIMTGLPSRRKMLLEMQKNRHKSIVMVNIDSFKEINDFYGHACGDEVLKELGRRLQGYLKHSPNFGALRFSLYKMPSDEFAILIRELPDEVKLQKGLEELTGFVSSGLFLWQGQEITLNVTCAAATANEVDKHENDTMLAAVNMALKLAKRLKKNYLIYESSMQIREEYEYNLIWAQKLKNAISQDRIIAYFQPIVNNESGEIEKFEALVRLMDENKEIISPYKFLNVAKKSRLYGKITEVMVQKSLEVFKDLSYELSINISYEDISDASTMMFTMARLGEYQMAERVSFELLESEGIDNYERVSEFIKDVKGLGCRISVDDFGSGYSNFEHLIRLSVDTIKIDGSLIKNIDTDVHAQVIVKSIVSFAKDIGFKTIAEFVHSKAVFEKVKEIGIDYSQGYFFGEPRSNISEYIVNNQGGWDGHES